MDVLIRNAEAEDLDWINTQYKDIGFLPSNLVDEDVVIAVADSTYAVIPDQIKRKHDWCRGTYEEEVSLLYKINNRSRI